MLLTTLQKYAADVRDFEMSFSSLDEFAAGDTITSISSLTASPSGLTIGSTSISPSNITVVISGGTSGTTYIVSAIVGTAAGATIEGQGLLEIF